MSDCIMVTFCSNNGFYGIFCRNINEESISHIFNYLCDKDQVEHFFTLGDVQKLDYHFPWLEIKRDNKRNIHYFENDDELFEMYNHVKNIYVFTKNERWIVNPKNKEDLTK